MKRFFKMLSVMLMVIVLSGCAKQHIHMNVTNTKVTIEVTDAMNSSLRTEEDVVAMKAEYEALGYDVKEYNGEEDGMLGVVYSKTYKLSDVSSDEAVVFHLETVGTEDFKEPKMFKVEKGLLGNTYRATFVFNTVDASVDGFDEEELEANADSIEIKYSVTLPSKAKSHNADSVDGKTYTWNVTYGENAEINYVFKTTSPIVFIVLGIVAVVVIAVVVLVILKKVKGNKNNQMPMTDQGFVTPVVNPNTPVQPVEAVPTVEPIQPVVVESTPETVVPAVEETPVESVVEPPTDPNQNM